MTIKKDLKKAKKQLRHYESKHPGDVEGYKNLSELVASLEKEDKRLQIVIAVKKEKACMRKVLEDMTEDEFLNQEFKENNKKNIKKVQEQARMNRVKFHNLIVKKIMRERLLKIREDYVRKLILHIDSETQ
jgi:hypothetical protein